MNITSPDKEMLRIKIIHYIETKTDIYRKYNLHLTDLMTYETDKSLDVILSKLTVSYGLPIKVMKYINSLIHLSTNLLKKYAIKTIVVKKKIGKSPKMYVLTYNNYDIRVSRKTYNRLQRLIIDNSYKEHYTFDTLVWMLYYRYYEMNLYNNSQGAVHPSHYKKLATKYNTEIEGFGSFFNHTLKYYYGLFPDLEKYFGCLGNFYESSLLKNLYVINPPYTTLQINLTIDHIISEFNKHSHYINVILILPAWLDADRHILNKICNKKINMKSYSKELKISKLYEHNIVSQYLLYCGDDFKYYDYIKEKDVYFTPTNVILLSNNKKDNKKTKQNKINIDLESIFGKASKHITS